MAGIRTRIESGFRKLANIIYDHRYKAAFLVLAFVVNIVIVAFLGFFFAGYIVKGRSRNSSDSRV